MGNFQNLAEFCEPIEISEVSTIRLDDIAEARGADYIKLDAKVPHCAAPGISARICCKCTIDGEGRIFLGGMSIALGVHESICASARQHCKCVMNGTAKTQVACVAPPKSNPGAQ